MSVLDWSDLTSLPLAQAAVNPTYAPSSSIPDLVLEGLDPGILVMLDLLHQEQYQALQDLYALLDIETMPRDALVNVLVEQGIPVPSFITTENLRVLARNAGDIRKFRNCAQGWQLYLQSCAPVGVTVAIDAHVVSDKFFMPGVLGYMLPGVTELNTYLSQGDLVPYLLGINDFTFEINISITLPSVYDDIDVLAGGLPSGSFAQFVQSTASSFVPMSADTTPVNVYIIP